MTKLATLLKSNILTLVGVLLGALGGYLYWKFIGCSSGTCPITGNPFISTIYGGLLGGLFLNLFKKKSA